MLDMGFQAQVNSIVNHVRRTLRPPRSFSGTLLNPPPLLPCDDQHAASLVRPDRQTLFFSATFKKRTETLASLALQDPVRIVTGLVGEVRKGENGCGGYPLNRDRRHNVSPIFFLPCRQAKTLRSSSTFYPTRMPSGAGC
jgi:hypothetical protein